MGVTPLCLQKRDARSFKQKFHWTTYWRSSKSLHSLYLLRHVGTWRIGLIRNIQVPRKCASAWMNSSVDVRRFWRFFFQNCSTQGWSAIVSKRYSFGIRANKVNIQKDVKIWKGNFASSVYTWYPKHPFFHGCLGKNIHFICKGLESLNWNNQ